MNLPPGQYQYKFIVDNKWRYAHDLPTVTDRDGNVNNMVELKELPRTQEALSLKAGSAYFFAAPSVSCWFLSHPPLASLSCGGLHARYTGGGFQQGSASFATTPGEGIPECSALS